MYPDDRKRAEELFQRAADLPPGQRGAFLDEHCAGDAELRAEVQALLRHADQAPESFLERPAYRPDDPTAAAADRPASGPLGPGVQLGDFRIEKQIGAGGMGIVYQARQVSLSRQVALKVLPPGLGLTSTARLRFHREAQAAAKLHHTNIVAIYAEGEESGTCFYAMELIEGQGLDQVLAGFRHLDAPAVSSSAPTITLAAPRPPSTKSTRSGTHTGTTLSVTGPVREEWHCRRFFVVMARGACARTRQCFSKRSAGGRIRVNSADSALERDLP